MDTRKDDEAELTEDPAVARLVGRVKRLVLVSTGVMMIGVVAVLSIIVARLVKPAPEGPPPERALDLPAGSRVLDVALGDGRLAVTVEEPGGRVVLRLFDAATLAPAGSLAVTGTP